MQGITFAQPTLTIAQMARQDQIDITVNQATAVIVCCYLEHMNAVIAKRASAPGSTDTEFVTRTELTNFINSVQTALRVVP